MILTCKRKTQGLSGSQTTDHSVRRGAFGLRREAERHAAFARTLVSLFADDLRPPESGVAAPALPPQSMTLLSDRHLQNGHTFFMRPTDSIVCQRRNSCCPGKRRQLKLPDFTLLSPRRVV
jgi:hypothetical protein